MSLSEAARALSRAARGSGLRIAGAESCTGGLASAAVTGRPRASEYFVGAAVVYANDAKTGLLGVGADTLARHGAVSAEAAEAMAKGALSAFGADLSFSITGIAGPGGGSEEKPVGTVWFGFATAGGSSTERRLFTGSRSEVRAAAAEYALARVAELANRLAKGRSKNGR